MKHDQDSQRLPNSALGIGGAAYFCPAQWVKHHLLSYEMGVEHYLLLIKI
jgi:hypothetical protein